MSRDVVEIDRLELFIARFLRYGVLLAGLLMLVGWMLRFDLSQNVFQSLRHYQHTPLGPELIALYRSQRWELLISYLGMAVLISLPFLRVLLTFVIFLQKRERALAMVSLLVLIALILSAALGLTVDGANKIAH